MSRCSLEERSCRRSNHAVPRRTPSAPASPRRSRAELNAACISGVADCRRSPRGRRQARSIDGAPNPRGDLVQRADQVGGRPRKEPQIGHRPGNEAGMIEAGGQRKDALVVNEPRTSVSFRPRRKKQPAA